MKKISAGLLLVASALIVGSAAAAWTSEAKVTRVRTYTTTSSYEAHIWFDRNVTTGCAQNSRVTVKTTNASMFEAVTRAATTAYLSNLNVEVNTFSGCEGDNGKLDYISLK
jgi:hypothetical protein